MGEFFSKSGDYAISEDFSKLYENVVFLHLRRQTKEVYYFKLKQEVDFYAKINGIPILVNVSYELKDDKTKQREVKGLLEAMDYFNIDKSYLVTKDEENVVVADGKKIVILPLYKYLLID